MSINQIISFFQNAEKILTGNIQIPVLVLAGLVAISATSLFLALRKPKISKEPTKLPTKEEIETGEKALFELMQQRLEADENDQQALAWMKNHNYEAQ
jgi:hypothetical protein